MTNLNIVDKEYHDLCNRVLLDGEIVMNARTGKNCIVKYGEVMNFNMKDGFPLLTTKKVLMKPIVGELIGFLRGYDSADKFRSLDCNIWDANANETSSWLGNANRKGTDDLGRIYGVQARHWSGPNGEIDQLKICIEKIKNRNDDRGLIVTHWNPGELDRMALRPCHMMYQFGIVGENLDLTMYQRSADIPLGIPFNIASYSLLLHIVAKMTGLTARKFTHFIGNGHIYEDQAQILKDEQLCRDSAGLPPEIHISDVVVSLNDIADITPEMITINNYKFHKFIKYPFSA